MYKVEYIRWDTPDDEFERLVKEHNLDKWYVDLVKADYCTILIISGDGMLSRSYSDMGEPEDSTFGRDWSWVKMELERAYQKGLGDGAK